MPQDVSGEAFELDSFDDAPEPDPDPPVARERAAALVSEDGRSVEGPAAGEPVALEQADRGQRGRPPLRHTYRADPARRTVPIDGLDPVPVGNAAPRRLVQEPVRGTGH